VNNILNQIDPKILSFGPEPNHTQLKSCERLVGFLQKNIILDDKYIKIFVNPYEQNVPEVLVKEIRTKKIPLPQLKPGGRHFKSFESLYGQPNSHHSKDSPKQSVKQTRS